MSDLNLAIKLTTSGGKIVVKDLRDIDAAADKVNHSLGNTSKSGSAAGQGLTQASGGADVLTGSLKSMLAQAAGVITLGLGIEKIASGMYDGIDAFQGYRGQLKTITGDFDSASVELDRLIQLSKETPFTLAQSVEGFSKLTHLGLDPSKQSMISYGNTAAAMGKDLMQMIEAVADAATGEFERLKEFGIKASSEGENVRLTFQGVSTTIKKDAASIEQYLIDLGNNKFGDAMGDQMGRLSAKSSNLQTSIAKLYDEIGKLGAADSIGNSIDKIANSVDEITQSLPEILEDITTLFEIMAVVVGVKLFAAFATLTRGAILPYTSAVFGASLASLKLNSSLLVATTQMKLMAVASNATKRSLAFLGGPVGVAMLAGYALYELHDAMNETKTGAEQLEEALGKTTKAIEKMTRAEQLATQNAYNKLITEKKAAIEEFKALAKEQAQQSKSANGKNSSTAYGMQSWGSSEKAKVASKELEALKNALSEVEGALFDAGMAGITWNKVIVNGVDLAKEKADAAAKLAANEKTELTTNQKLIASLEEQLKLSKLTGLAKLEEINLSKLSDKIKDGEIAKVKELTAALYDQLQITAQKQDDSEFYQSVIDGANDIGESWNTAGNVIVNTFGTISDQLDKLAQQQEKYATKQKKLAADKVKYADDPKKLAEIAKAENALAKQKAGNAMSEIGSYRAITDSAASMFNENSKGRKAMQAASDVFTTIELANSALRIGSYAIEAVAAAFAAPWPIGFASGAAMIAIMASLGVAVSGGSGSAPMSAAERQETQGTGTVLGSDEKSQSLNNSFARIEELELDQYVELRQMNTSLRDLNKNITHLAVSLVSNFGKFDEKDYGGQLGTSGQLNGDVGGLASFALGGVGGFIDSMTFGIAGKIIGGFKSTKKSLVDSGISIVSQTMGDIIETGLVQSQQYFDIKTKKKSFWGAKKSTKYNTEYSDIDEQLEREMALIFSDIGNSINNAVDVLGVDITRTLSSFVIDLPNISLKDLSGDEIQAELEALFSSQADLMSIYLVPGLADFQKVGEGLFDTLIRLAQEQAVFNSVLEITGNTLANVDPNQTIEATQAIIEFAGGIENLQSAATTYLSEFFTEQEQFTFLTTKVNEQFAALGITLPTTQEAFKSLVSGLDLTAEADQRLYAQLMLLSPKMAEYYSALKEQSEAFSDSANSIKTFNESISQQLAALDFTPLESKLTALQAEFDEYYRNSQGADISLLEQLHSKKRQKIIDEALTSINDAHENAASKLTAENNKITASFDSLSSNIAASILSIKKQAKGWDEQAYQDSNVTSLTNLLGQGSIQEQIVHIEKVKQATLDKYNADLAGLNNSRDLAQRLYDEQLAQVNEQYQLELDIYNSISDALLSLKDAADNLLLSDYSTLTNEQKLGEAQSQFDAIWASAKNGDIDSLNKLQGAGDSYLKEAQKYYASGADYSAIFDKVYDALNTLGNSSATAPTKPGAVELPSAIADYDELLAALQKTTIDSLTGLDSISQSLSLSVTTEFDESMFVLNEKLEENRLAVIANTIAIQTPNVPVANTDNADVVRALADVKAELALQNKKADERIKQAQAQAAAAEEKTDKMIVAFNQSRRAYERQMDEWLDADLRRYTR